MTEKKLSRRRFFTSTATIAGASALSAACTSKEAPGVVSGEKPKITFWLGTSYTPEADELQDNQIRDWCTKNNVELELARMSSDERKPKWQTAYETKQFPDVASVYQDDLPKFIVSKVLVETTDTVKRMNKLEGGFTEGSFIAGRTEDGKHWSVPGFSSTEVFYVRKDKVEEKGLKIPTTWDEVFDVAKAITVPGDFWGWGMQIGTPSWDSEVAFTSKLWSWGGSTWGEDTKPAIDSKETRALLDWLNEVWKSGVIPPDAPTGDDAWNNKAYQTGIVGMAFNTGSILSYMQNSDPDLLSKTAVIPIPAGPKGRFCSGYFYQFAAFNTTKHSDVCLELLEWLLAPDQVRPWYEAAGGNFLPTYNDLLKDEMWQDPDRKVLADMVPFTRPQGYPGLTTPWCQEAWLDHTMVKMLNRVLLDGWDNDRAIDEANKALQKYYDDWQKLLG
jgi:multiple sugar transport system substrate-binding protein